MQVLRELGDDIRAPPLLLLLHEFAAQLPVDQHQFPVGRQGSTLLGRGDPLLKRGEPVNVVGRQNEVVFDHGNDHNSYREKRAFCSRPARKDAQVIEYKRLAPRAR
jgi:hypothetical protein